MFFPQAAPIIAIVQRALPFIAAAQPAISAAIAEGRPALQAAEAAAPQFASAVKDLFAHASANLRGALSGASDGAHLENITRLLGGFHRMTPEEEKRWMDNQTPHGDPSQENSKFGG